MLREGLLLGFRRQRSLHLALHHQKDSLLWREHHQLLVLLQL